MFYDQVLREIEENNPKLLARWNRIAKRKRYRYLGRIYLLQNGTKLLVVVLVLGVIGLVVLSRLQ